MKRYFRFLFGVVVCLSLVGVALIADVPAVADPDTIPLTISGRVVDAVTGNPVGSAYVYVADYADRTSGCGSAFTGFDGTYTVTITTPAPGGEYGVAVYAQYLPNTYATEWFDNATHGERSATPVAAPAINIDFRLHRGVPITGTVTDAETGAPLEGVAVYVITYDSRSADYYDWEFVAQTPTGGTAADGTYTTYPAPAGDYALIAVPPEHLPNAPRWYSDSDLWGMENATKVSVSPPSPITGIDFVLPLKMEEFAVNQMSIDFDQRPNRDRIDISEATFSIPEDTYNLDSCDVRVFIDSVVISIPAGSFIWDAKKASWTFSSPSGVEPKVDMMLDFSEGTWSLDVSKIDASLIDNSNGVSVYLLIGFWRGWETINMRVDHLSYQAEP